MSQLEEIRKRLESEEAFENSAEIGLNLLAALEAVEAVHYVSDIYNYTLCSECREAFPCQTVSAITEALQ